MPQNKGCINVLKHLEDPEIWHHELQQSTSDATLIKSGWWSFRGAQFLQMRTLRWDELSVSGWCNCVPAAGGDSSPVTLTKTHHPSSPLLPPGIMRSGSQMLPKQTRFSASWNEISFHQLSSGVQSTLQHSLKGIPSSSSSLPARSTGNISYQISDQETKSWLMLSGTGNKHEPG